MTRAYLWLGDHVVEVSLFAIGYNIVGPVFMRTVLDWEPSLPMVLPGLLVVLPLQALACASALWGDRYDRALHDRRGEDR